MSNDYGEPSLTPVSPSTSIGQRIQTLAGMVQEFKASVGDYINQSKDATPGRAYQIVRDITSPTSRGSGMNAVVSDIDTAITDLINAIQAMGPTEYTGRPLNQAHQWNQDLETLRALKKELEANAGQATIIADQLKGTADAFQTQLAALAEMYKRGDLEYMPELWAQMSETDRQIVASFDPDAAVYFNGLAQAPEGYKGPSTTKTTTTGSGGGISTPTTQSAVTPPKPSRNPFPVLGTLNGKPIYGRDAEGKPPSDLTIQESGQSSDAYTMLQKSNGFEFINLGDYTQPGMGFTYEYLQNADLEKLGFSGEMLSSLRNVQTALQEEQAYYDNLMRERNEANLAAEREADQKYRSELTDKLGIRGWGTDTSEMSNRELIKMIGEQQAKDAEDAKKKALDEALAKRYPQGGPIVVNP